MLLALDSIRCIVLLLNQDVNHRLSAFFYVLSLFYIFLRVVAGAPNFNPHDGVTLEAFQDLADDVVAGLGQQFVQFLDELPFELLTFVQFLNDSSKPVILLLKLLPDIVGDVGDVAAEPLIDGLLYLDAGHESIQVAFAFGDIDKSDDNSAAGVEDKLAVVEVIPDGEGQVEEVHLQQQECLVLGRREVFGLEGSNIAEFLVVDVFVVPERGLLELLGI